MKIDVRIAESNVGQTVIKTRSQKIRRMASCATCMAFALFLSHSSICFASDSKFSDANQLTTPSVTTSPNTGSYQELVTLLEQMHVWLIQAHSLALSTGSTATTLGRKRDYKIIEDKFKAFSEMVRDERPNVRRAKFLLDDVQPSSRQETIRRLLDSYRADANYEMQFMQLVIRFERTLNSRNRAQSAEAWNAFASAINPPTVTTSSRVNGYGTSQSNASCYGSQCYANGNSNYSGTVSTTSVYNNSGERSQEASIQNGQNARYFDMTASDLEPQIEAGMETIRDNVDEMILAERHAAKECPDLVFSNPSEEPTGDEQGKSATMSSPSPPSPSPQPIVTASPVVPQKGT